MKTLRLFLILFLLWNAGSLCAQSTFRKLYQISTHENLLSAAEGSNSQFYMLSEDGNVPGGAYVYLSSADQNGNPLWSKVFSHPLTYIPYEICDIGTGIIIASKFNAPANPLPPVVLHKTDYNGNVLWSIQIDSMPLFDIGNKTLFHIPGDTTFYFSNYGYYSMSFNMFKFTGSGRLLWTKGFDNANHNLGEEDLFLAGDHNFYYKLLNNNGNHVIMSCDTSMNLRWMNTYIDYLDFMAVSSTHTITFSANTVSCIRNDGTYLWSKYIFSGAPTGNIQTIEPCTNGHFLIIAEGLCNHSCRTIVNIDSSGTVFWQKNFPIDSLDYNSTHPFELQNGDWMLAGSGYQWQVSNYNTHPVLFRIDANGNYNCGSITQTPPSLGNWLALTPAANPALFFSQPVYHTTTAATLSLLPYSISTISSCTPNGLDETSNENLFHLSYSESANQIEATHPSGAEIFLFSTSGQLIHSEKSSGNRSTINLSGKAAGIYIIRIISNNNTYTGKMVKTGE